MQNRPTALVLGAGIMGLGAAWGLRREGFAVTVVDQATPPNPHGSSVDHHRLIRHSYGAQHGYMRMVDAAYAAWEELWAELGQVLHVPTGVLSIDETGCTRVATSRAALALGGYPTEDLTGPEIEARFPYLSGGHVADALFCPLGGVLLAGRIVGALADHLRAQGVVFEQARAMSVDPARGAITLEGGATRAADVLVVAAGPWAPRLLPALHGRVVASRQVIIRLMPPAETLPQWERAPMVLELGETGGFYLVPPVAGTPLKIGDHSFSRQGDPDEPTREADPREVARILDLARARIPGLDGFTLVDSANCFYDVEDEERFVIEPLSPRAWVMSGFSGHGFKFGAVLGLRLARTIARNEDAAAFSAWAAGEESLPA
ncbi:FAD-dependent oxidoreductase [Roseococcus thiosulfatophilus]|uniref:FAD-dependent oxidoreductase n=1 Tax=Roseococcus thiosulfatophilus TaxID=35813 RepID=UPI001A8E45E6|nr:FAD-dependent oxidoreductase [Roseococcus thiosulfatophilus]